MKNFSFTLAEVLITLVVIGIITALTIIIFQERVWTDIYKNRWKKVYSEINQAYLMVQSREDLSSYYDSDKNYSFNYVVQEILKQYKQIDLAARYNVIWDKISYKNILGSKVTVAPLLHRAYDTNGMTIYYWSYSPGGCSIWVDVNGSSNAPNTFGKDMFALEIREKNIYAFGQFAKGDWCRGKGTTLGVKYVQSTTPSGGDSLSDKYGEITSDTYAGLGCSYEYLYE